MKEFLQRKNFFTSNQLEQLGRVLAKNHRVIGRSSNASLVKRLKLNQKVLRTTYRFLTHANQSGRQLPPAGEWLLDNFHSIENQMRTSIFHLPESFYRKLPWAEDRTSQRQPRIYLIAREIIEHTNGQLDLDGLHSVLETYRNSTDLHLSELWALPIMLRIGLIENLRLIAGSIATTFIDQSNARFWAEKINSIDPNDSDQIIACVSELASCEPRLSSPFISEFSRRIRNANPSLSLAMSWLEIRMRKNGRSLADHQKQLSQDSTRDQISISNSLASLRLLNRTDWNDFVEKQSKIHRRLLNGPAKIYSVDDGENHRIEVFIPQTDR